MEEKKLGDLSDIKVQFFTVPSNVTPNRHILVIQYVGSYRDGAAGNDDGVYMSAMAAAGLEAFGGWGVVHDCRQLRYEWGDWLERLFDVGYIDGHRQVAIVVGPACEQAIVTLIEGFAPEKSIEDIPYAFRNLDDAIRFVDKQIR